MFDDETIYNTMVGDVGGAGYYATIEIAIDAGAESIFMEPHGVIGMAIQFDLPWDWIIENLLLGGR